MGSGERVNVLRVPELRIALLIVWAFAIVLTLACVLPYAIAGSTWGIRYGRIWGFGVIIALAPVGWWYERRFGTQKEIGERLALGRRGKLQMLGWTLLPLVGCAVVVTVVASAAGLD